MAVHLKTFALATIVTIYLLAFKPIVAEVDDLVDESAAPFRGSIPTLKFLEPKVKGDVAFIETFTDSWDKRWIHSVVEKYTGKL